MAAADFTHDVPGGVRLAVRVQPRANRNQVNGVIDGEVRIHIAAPPVDAAANQELIRFLSKTLKCPKSAIKLLRGERSRHKLLEIQGLSAARILGALV